MMLSLWFSRQLIPGIGEPPFSASSVCCLAMLWAKLSLEASGGVGKDLWRFGCPHPNSTRLHTIHPPPQYIVKTFELSWAQKGTGAAGKLLRGLDLNQRPLGYEPNELPELLHPAIKKYTQFTGVCQLFFSKPNRLALKAKHRRYAQPIEAPRLRVRLNRSPDY